MSFPIEERCARTGGVDFCYGAGGAGPRRVLCLHGLYGTWRYLRPSLEALGDLATFYAPDLPGYGASGPSPTGYSLPEFVRHLLGFADAVGLETFTALGHSLGGILAAAIAQAAPERVEHLILVSPPIVSAGVHPAIRALAYPGIGRLSHELARLVVRLGLRAALKYLPEMSGIAREIGRYALRPDWPTIHNTVRGLYQAHREGWQRLLGEVTAPTDIIFGEKDDIVPAWHGKRWVEYMPHARLHLMPGVAHMPMLETPSAFVALLRQLLAAPVPSMESIPRLTESGAGDRMPREM